MAYCSQAGGCSKTDDRLLNLQVYLNKPADVHEKINLHVKVGEIITQETRKELEIGIFVLQFCQTH